ncbi:MAG: hypothetical protein ABI658_21130 [Acidimicrobiales bacterium]
MADTQSGQGARQTAGPIALLAFIALTALVVSIMALVVALANRNHVATGTAHTSIMGSEKEWEVRASASQAKTGEVTFTVKNEGTIGHEFLVVRTDIAPGKIPIDGDHFSEDAVEVVDEIGEFAAGATETLTVTLAPGKYQLVCNLPTHYGNGMFTGFEVTA